MRTPHLPFYGGEQSCEDVELDVEDAFGDHDIEYWVRQGNKLVPATEDEVAQIHEWEHEAPARTRLAVWQRTETRSWSARLLHTMPFGCASWIWQRVGRQRAPAETVREQERHSHSPVRPQIVGGYDKHGDETTT
jgi:hypothetical protein